MKVIIRADASLSIGAGHVMRCLTLANALRERGATLLFVCREHEGHLCDAIEERGFAVSRLFSCEVAAQAQDTLQHASWLGASWRQDVEHTFAAIETTCIRPDWLVVDHYALDHRWENALREHTGRIAVIDDLADRHHDCDLLLDQNCLPGHAARYKSLVSSDCEKLFGPRFVLLRPEFQVAKEERQPTDGVIRRILVFFGSVDIVDYTSAAILAIRRLGWPGLEVDVVTGAANPRQAAVRRLCELEPKYNYHRQVTNMAQLMVKADLAVSAGGFTSYELAYMGVPSVLFPLTAIQEEVSSEIAAHGAAITLGRTTQFPRGDFVRVLSELNGSPTRCMKMAQIGQALFDGMGANRVADVLMRT